ncbi:hypothetical protein F4553_006057 [Allocatelliglobosispora scoriae]|uniref:Uncharacterized protein n=1 Tax=Allocatelliglobosispora scoriae TaxID=643052 RepID=A0A841C0E5_9ACTN|nr:hypothetical protein [Allocatelliglobosispora scoriae]MBB5872623.1 hypothetical protein [Allocatelliglobosispora scoriae]
MHRIRTDFPHHTGAVLERLQTLGNLIARSRQDEERILGAVIILADGRLDRLEEALALAKLDWRDLLVAADMAEATWPGRLGEWLNPYEPHPAPADPTMTGEYVDSDGHRWVLRRRRIDLRVVRRLLHRSDVVVVLRDGLQPRPVPGHERAAVWDAVRRSYAGPGGPDQVIGSIDYMGYEFTGDGGAVLLYLQERC